jgi:hemerythrin-like domain-containing protein
MDELISEHILGRNNVKALIEARNSYEKGQTEALRKVVEVFEKLINFYPKHIKKEDKHFFLEVMEYFDDNEKQAMLEAYWEFDKKLIHEKYANLVENIDKQNNPG